MFDMNALTAFFGWCTLLNIGIYLFTVTALWLLRDFAYRLNARIFAVDEAMIARVTLQYIGMYKLLINVCCFVPWLALKLMAALG